MRLMDCLLWKVEGTEDTHINLGAATTEMVLTRVVALSKVQKIRVILWRSEICSVFYNGCLWENEFWDTKNKEDICPKNKIGQIYSLWSIFLQYDFVGKCLQFCTIIQSNYFS